MYVFFIVRDLIAHMNLVVEHAKNYPGNGQLFVRGPPQTVYIRIYDRMFRNEALVL